SVAVADVDKDGVPDIITGAGAGGGPHVEVFDGRTGTEKAGFLAYAPDFRGGVRVAALDLDGDGRAEVVTAPGAGGGRLVKVFDGSGRERFALLVGPPESRDGVQLSDLGYTSTYPAVRAELPGRPAFYLAGPTAAGDPLLRVDTGIPGPVVP